MSAPSTDKTVAEWEKHCFLNSYYFSVVLFLGRAQFERQHFAAKDIRQAVEAARKPSTNTRPRMLYGVTAQGRQVLVKPADYDSWLAEFEEHGKSEHKQAAQRSAKGRARVPH